MLELENCVPKDERCIESIFANMNAESQFVRSGAFSSVASLILKRPSLRPKVLVAISDLSPEVRSEIADEWERPRPRSQHRELLEFAAVFDPPTKQTLFRDFGHGLGSTVASMLQRLGEPQSISTGAWRGSLGPILYEEYRFPGVIAQIRITEDLHSPNRPLRGLIRINRPGYEFRNGIRIGTTAKDVLKVFGKPWNVTGDSIAYCNNMEGCPDLQFMLIDGKVSEVVW